MSSQIVWIWYSKASHGMFSHIGGSVQRLANGNTLICSDTEGHIIEVTAAGEAVWEYINPVATDGIVKFKRDNWPMYNAIFRAFRYQHQRSALTGRTLPPGTPSPAAPRRIIRRKTPTILRLKTARRICMKTLSNLIIAAVVLVVSSITLDAYERLQGPTEVIYWDKTQTGK